MSFFFCPTDLAIGTRVEMEGSVAHHIGTVRRIKKGEEIQLQDPRMRRFLARVDAVTKRSVTITPLSEITLPPETAHTVTLIQALVSEQNIDLILQKATELGAQKIVLFQSEHSPHSIRTDRLPHKLDRWTEIARNACEQSGRPSLPLIIVTPSLTDALEDAAGVIVVLDQSGDAFPNPQTLTLIVGPEGGLSEGEISLLKNRSALFARISAYTLRSETAALAGLASALRS